MKEIRDEETDMSAYKFAPAKGEAVPHGLAPSVACRLDPTPSERSNPIRHGQPLVLESLGANFTEQKGHPLLIQPTKLVAANGSQARLLGVR